MHSGYRNPPLFLLFWLATLPVFSQVTDNFSDGDFTTSPAWSGDVAEFIVNPANQLQLNNTVADTSYLSTAFSAASLDNTEWQVWVRQTFSPSGSNYGRVYLVSDQPALDGPLNGYFLQFGEAGSNDAIELFRQQGTTITSVCRATNAMIAASFTVRVKVVRDNVGNWTIFADYTGGATFVSEASGTDAVINASSRMGVFCLYTVSNSTKFFFDDFYAGPAIVDNTAPTVVNVTATSGSTLDVLFDEPVSSATASAITNYTVSNGLGNPISAVPDGSNPSLVHLSFSANFQSQAYTLTVSGVQDLAGNTISTQVIPFTYTVPATPVGRSVVINELMPDPSPQVALPNTEYVELFNADTVAYNLAGWQLTDGSSTATLTSFQLNPGAYVTIVAHADTAAFSTTGNVLGVSSFPSLNNSSDSLVLKDAQGGVIDRVMYQVSWYGSDLKDDGGWSLEQVNPFLPCSGGNNWRASNNISGGTPGQQNSIFSQAPDTTSPLVTAINTINPSLIEVHFSEIMDGSSVTYGYTISSGIVVSQVQVISGSVTVVLLSLTSPLQAGVEYTLSLTGQSDCSGNVVSPLSYTFGFGVNPVPLQIVMTELFPDPAGSPGIPEYEFVELYNNSAQVVNLAGVSITDGTSTATIPAGNLLPYSYVILTASANSQSFLPYGKVIGVSTLPSLNNNGDKITLKFQGTTLHQVNYNDSWFNDDTKNDGGWTLEMVDPSNPCAGMSNWRASTSPSGGTPGQVNAVDGNNPDNDPPKITEAIAIAVDTVEVRFNENLDSLNAVSAIYQIVDGPAVLQVIAYADKVHLVLAGGLTPNTTYEMVVNNLTDCSGNISSVLYVELIFPVAGEPGDIILNEILFNPRTGGSDFIEIYNYSSSYIDLSRWKIANFQYDSVSNIKMIATAPLIIKPGAFKVLTKDSSNIRMEYPQSVPGTFVQIESLPSYNNDQGSVILLAPDASIAERFDYTEDIHFGLIDDPKGVTLERISYSGNVNDPGNWHSAASTVGFATPGFENSQHQEFQAAGGTVSLPVKIFSPDNDGHQDILQIAYDFEEAGYTANVTVYNSRGERKKEIARNELLATDGTLTWDGTFDDLTKAPVGIYVIYFEAFRLDGTLFREKLAAVVAARL